MSVDQTFLFLVDDDSTNETPTLKVSLPNLLARENEMVQTASKLGVGATWDSSLLYGEYQTNPLQTTYTLDCHGKSWLNAFTLEWIARYYQTGMLHIPADAHGYAVLAALEYFAILYSPDQCHFADFNVYERVQMWARYLTHREALAETVRESTNEMQFAVAPSASESMDLGTSPIAPLGGAELANIAYRLFQQHDQEATVKELRDDFCHHVSSAVGPAKFSVKPVTLHAPTKVVHRAVLTIQRKDRRRKPVFMLPDELDKSNLVIKTDDNTVTSGLTGPFYTDTRGLVKDIFEHEEAKRHEWVQTALMNRGISERMEKLLNPVEEPKHPEIWEWLTGWGVCEMSRSVVESVGDYMKEKKPSAPAPVITLNTRPRSRSVVKDRIKEKMTELSDKKDCDSKESPRGVADYHHQFCQPQRTQPQRIQPERIQPQQVKLQQIQPQVIECTPKNPPEQNVVPPSPKKKGFMGLFRRRREETGRLHHS